MVSQIKEQKNGGTSKARREQIKNGIDEAKKELPLSKTDSENLSQLQTLHCSCTYIRKMESFKQLNLKRQESEFYNNPQLQHLLSNQLALSETLFGFVIVLSRDRHLLYVSENVVDYLGLRAIEVLLSCERFEDILHPNDANGLIDVFNSAHLKLHHEFYCSWNASKIKRRVHTKADAKVIKINGRFIANGNLFVATCTPMLRSVNREHLVATSPTCFTSVHSLDMKFMELCEKGQNILDYPNNQIEKFNLYDILHVKDLELVRKRHKNLLNTKSQKGKVDSVKILKRDGTYINCLVNIYYCVNSIIICKFQLLSENEVYHYENYMNSLTELPQIDGADGVAECDDEINLSEPSSIDSSPYDDSEYDSYIVCNKGSNINNSNNNSSQVSKKRKFDEDVEIKTTNNSPKTKHQRISVDSCANVKVEANSPQNVDELYQNFQPTVSYFSTSHVINSPQNQYPQLITMPLQPQQFMFTSFQQYPNFSNSNTYNNNLNVYPIVNQPVYSTEQYASYVCNQDSPSGSSINSDDENLHLDDLQLQLSPKFLEYLNENDICNIAQESAVFSKIPETMSNNNIYNTDDELDDIMDIIQKDTSSSPLVYVHKMIPTK